MPSCLTLATQYPAPPDMKHIPGGPGASGKHKQALATNYTVSINYLALFHAPSVRRDSYQAVLSQGLRGYLPEARQGPSYLWNMQGLSIPSLSAEVILCCTCHPLAIDLVILQQKGHIHWIIHIYYSTQWDRHRNSLRVTSFIIWRSHWGAGIDLDTQLTHPRKLLHTLLCFCTSVIAHFLCDLKGPRL